MNKFSGKAWALVLLFGAALLILPGCATDNPENVSALPWNTPKSWENGLPSAMTEGR